jgi:hypothetical protein
VVLWRLPFIKINTAKISQQSNDDRRSCWQVGPSMYSILVAGSGYSILSVLCASLMNQKYRFFQNRLRQFYYDHTVQVKASEIVHMTSLENNATEIILTPLSQLSVVGQKILPPEDTGTTNLRLSDTVL